MTWPGPLSPGRPGHITLQPLTVRQGGWPWSGKCRAPKNFLGAIRRRIFWAARARTASARGWVSVAPGAGIPLLRRESSVTSINAPDHAASACDRELRCAATGARFVMGGPTPAWQIRHALCLRARLSSVFVTTCAEVDAGKQHVGASASWAPGPAMSCRDPREGGAGISPAASARCGSAVSATMSTWAFSDYSCP